MKGARQVATTARPRLAQVASEAGVSVASASRALNGASASPEMVAKVRRVARELGYEVHVTARSLKMGRTEQLAFVVADLGNPVYVAMMRALEGVVRQAGYRLIVSASGSQPAEEMQVIRGLKRGYADGLVISPLRITEELVTELLGCRVPVVVVGKLPPGVPLDNVRTDSARGIGLAVRHLIDAGRDRIGFINGPRDTVPGRSRAAGFERAMRTAERPTTRRQVAAAAAFTHAAGEKAAADLLAGYRPDAVVCANDLIALGALRALHAAGYDVPAEVAIVGMDDTELAELAVPALTSVSLRSEQRGQQAASMLLDRIADPALRSRRVTFQPRLVVRDSSAPRPNPAGRPSRQLS